MRVIIQLLQASARQHFSSSMPHNLSICNEMFDACYESTELKWLSQLMTEKMWVVSERINHQLTFEFQS